MEITFYKVKTIKIDAVKNRTRAGASWLKINVSDQEGEHIINCFPEPGEIIPMSLHPIGDADG